MKIFNTLSGQKEDFRPGSNTITMYVCGVTVYDECHIGHAMSYIVFDAIKRYLEYKGYQVKHVQNFTDIDDKIINRATQLGISATDLAEKYIAEYFQDMDKLNIRRVTIYPKATEEIPKIIEMIRGLIKKEFAYESAGSVYFRVNKYKNYGKLSHQNTEQMIAETTAETVNKESPLDFALWKAAKTGEPAWTSPWGQGRPGWHIECSAMSLKYLGASIDIHGGGQDLIFPHHENEITQSESYTGVTPFAKYWLHNGLLQLHGNKMSKSIGNLITVKDLLKLFSPDAIRLFMLSSHYRSPLLFAEESIKAAEVGIDRLRLAIKPRETDNSGEESLKVDAFEQKFSESMDDDFNTAQAIAVLFDLSREINRAREKSIQVVEAVAVLQKLASVLGFTLQEPERQPVGIEPLIDLLISLRHELRNIKQYQMADKIRDTLTELGIALEDANKQTTWRYLTK
jgi:cysteinyl-tRNA synthetase